MIRVRSEQTLNQIRKRNAANGLIGALYRRGDKGGGSRQPAFMPRRKSGGATGAPCTRNPLSGDRANLDVRQPALDSVRPRSLIVHNALTVSTRFLPFFDYCIGPMDEGPSTQEQADLASLLAAVESALALADSLSLAWVAVDLSHACERLRETIATAER